MRLIALFLIATMALPNTGQSQVFDFSMVEPGIMAGFNQSLMHPAFVDEALQSEEILSVSQGQNPGISMGLTTAYPLTGFLKVRAALIYSRYDNKLKYLVRSTGNGTSTHVERPAIAALEMPLHMVISPSNYNTDPALIIGPRYGYNLVKNDADHLLHYTRHNLGLDMGVSATFATRFVDIIPQLSYTVGLTPLATSGTGAISGSIKQLDRNALHLSIFLR